VSVRRYSVWPQRQNANSMPFNYNVVGTPTDGISTSSTNPSCICEDLQTLVCTGIAYNTLSANPSSVKRTEILRNHILAFNGTYHVQPTMPGLISSN